MGHFRYSKKNMALLNRVKRQAKKTRMNLMERKPPRSPLSDGRILQTPTFRTFAMPRPAVMNEVRKVNLNKLSLNIPRRIPALTLPMLYPPMNLPLMYVMMKVVGTASRKTSASLISRSNFLFLSWHRSTYP